MTKLLTPKILLMLLMSFFSTTAIAHDIEVKNADGVTIYYNWINNKTELEVSYRGDKSGAFSNEYSGNVVIPKSVNYNGTTYSVTSISNLAFYDCSGLTSITIPNSVTSIGGQVFYGCNVLSSIEVESGNIKYDSRDNCNAIIETSSNTLIAGSTNTIIPNSVTSIGYGAFEGRSGLTSITFPNSVTEIGYEAFMLCTGLTSIELPSSIKRIGGRAFDNCSISTVTIPSSVTDIAKGNGESSPFGVCNSLISIKVESGNTVYDSRNNCNAIIETATNELVAGCKTTIIPNSVTSIAYYSMCGFKDLTSITIPNSVTSIAFGAFEGCGLTSITIPNSVTYIGNSAFYNCNSLTSIISKIQNPFVIKDDVFYCNNKDIYATATLTVPKGTKAAYQATAGWNKFANIVESDGSESVQTKRTIHVAKAGTLSNYISNDEKYQIEELTLTGEINGDDLGFLREMAGQNKMTGAPFGDKTEGRLKNLDISGTKIVSGGTYMIEDRYASFDMMSLDFCLESDDEIPAYLFEGCAILETIKVPDNLKSIGFHAFDGTTWYNNQPDGMVYLGKVLYKYKGDMPENAKITIKDGTLGIAGLAFENCKNMIAISIPNSVVRIGVFISRSETYMISNCGAFYGCSGLTSITIPNSVTTIGYGAFWGCGGLTSIISKIQNPFVIKDDVFKCSNKDIYATATLTVPKGTKAAYQATEGWNKFANIVEEGVDEVMFTTDGVTYQGSSSNKTAVVKSVDTKLKTLEIPASVSYNGTSYQVTGIADNAFSGCTLAALIWNADAALPSNAFSSASIGSNFLLYVKSESYAPSSVKNIIVNGTAQTIVLSDDGGNFYCPQSFTARSISYTHNYSMETGGSGMGWETIALPFNVQKVSHSSRGEIVPFASYNSGSNQKPFWLASMASGGFRSSSSIQANTPYIIAMPNNSSYRNDYILAGDVTFSAENVNVSVTPTFSGFFVPAYSTIAKSASVYALNVRNRYVTNTGNYVAGSRFISNLRDIRPFEAYLSVGSSTRGVIEIGFSDGTTGMADVIGAFDADRPIDIYTLSGQKVAQGKQSELDVILDQLPHGVYIVNGKKIVK